MKKSDLAEHPLTAPQKAAERRRGAVPESAPALESRDGRGTSPGMDEVERSTTAGMQEVGQCQEQLPRMPEPGFPRPR